MFGLTNSQDILWKSIFVKEHIALNLNRRSNKILELPTQGGLLFPEKLLQGTFSERGILKMVEHFSID